MRCLHQTLSFARLTFFLRKGANPCTQTALNALLEKGIFPNACSLANLTWHRLWTDLLSSTATLWATHIPFSFYLLYELWYLYALFESYFDSRIDIFTVKVYSFFVKIIFSFIISLLAFPLSFLLFLPICFLFFFFINIIWMLFSTNMPFRNELIILFARFCLTKCIVSQLQVTKVNLLHHFVFCVRILLWVEKLSHCSKLMLNLLRSGLIFESEHFIKTFGFSPTGEKCLSPIVVKIWKGSSTTFEQLIHLFF